MLTTSGTTGKQCLYKIIFYRRATSFVVHFQLNIVNFFCQNKSWFQYIDFLQRGNNVITFVILHTLCEPKSIYRGIVCFTDNRRPHWYVWKLVRYQRELHVWPTHVVQCDLPLLRGEQRVIVNHYGKLISSGHVCFIIMSFTFTVIISNLFRFLTRFLKFNKISQTPSNTWLLT